MPFRPRRSARLRWRQPVSGLDCANIRLASYWNLRIIARLFLFEQRNIQEFRVQRNLLPKFDSNSKMISRTEGSRPEIEALLVEVQSRAYDATPAKEVTHRKKGCLVALPSPIHRSRVTYLICKLSTSRVSFTTKSTLSTKSPLWFEENDKLKDLSSSGLSVRLGGVTLIVPPKSVRFSL